MDYSLLVGIHDCTIAPDSDEEDFDKLEEDGYVSSDDIGDAPHSPQSPGWSSLLMCLLQSVCNCTCRVSCLLCCNFSATLLAFHENLVPINYHLLWNSIGLHRS